MFLLDEETEQGRLFAICSPRLLSDLLVVLVCNTATVNVSPNALGRALPWRDNPLRSYELSPHLLRS